jgi:hypothetical protein
MKNRQQIVPETAGKAGKKKTCTTQANGNGNKEVGQAASSHDPLLKNLVRGGGGKL